MAKNKPKWVRTDIARDVKIKLWGLMRDTSNYPQWERAIARADFTAEESKQFGINRDTWKRLSEEARDMPADEIELLPPDLIPWVKGLQGKDVEVKTNGQQAVSLAEAQAAAMQRTKHWDDLAGVAAKLVKAIKSAALSSVGPSEKKGEKNGTPVFGWSDDYDIGSLLEDIGVGVGTGREYVSETLARSLLTHLQNEYRELRLIKRWDDLPVNKARPILEKVAARRTFNGTCAICEDWSK